jgi:hypothetical protein
MDLHRVTSGWTEGTDNAEGDREGSGTAASSGATWLFRDFPDTTWSTAGGDFAAEASSTSMAGQCRDGISLAKPTFKVALLLCPPST